MSREVSWQRESTKRSKRDQQAVRTNEQAKRLKRITRGQRNSQDRLRRVSTRNSPGKPLKETPDPDPDPIGNFPTELR
jgi:hypothetical protein